MRWKLALFITFITALSLSAQSRYPGIKADASIRWQSSVTPQQQRSVLENVFAQSRYGSRDSVRAMVDFGVNQYLSINPNAPGLFQNHLLIASDNKQVAKGALRTQLYANTAQKGGRFDVVSLNQQRLTSIGKTDADLVLKCRVTGTLLRVEVKQLKLLTQDRNLTKYKLQLDKMALDTRIGEKAVWVNRGPVHTEIKQYATSKGIDAYGNVKTGTITATQRPSHQHLNNILSEQQTKILAERSSVVGRVVANVPSAQGSFSNRSIVTGRLPKTSMNFGKLVTSGCTLTEGLLASQVTTNTLKRSTGMLRSLKVLGIAGTVLGAGVEEVMLYNRYSNGELDTNQFLRENGKMGATIAAGAGGAVAGAWIGGIGGGLIGSIVPGAGTAIGATTGAWVGGFAGGFVASWGSNQVFDNHFSTVQKIADAKSHDKYIEHLQQHYTK